MKIDIYLTFYADSDDIKKALDKGVTTIGGLGHELKK